MPGRNLVGQVSESETHVHNCIIYTILYSSSDVPKRSFGARDSLTENHTQISVMRCSMNIFCGTWRRFRNTYTNVISYNTIQELYIIPCTDVESCCTWIKIRKSCSKQNSFYNLVCQSGIYVYERENQKIYSPYISVSLLPAWKCRSNICRRWSYSYYISTLKSLSTHTKWRNKWLQ